MSDCKWAGTDRPRILPGRHAEACGNDNCPGCQECTRPHCRVCAVSHAAGTCAECLAETREALRDIGRMCDALPDEVEHRGVDGEAMMLLGPVADNEARGWLEASVACGRVPADWIDTADNDRHPLFVLGEWRMVWADVIEDDNDQRMSLPDSVEYLDRNLHRMSDNEHLPFEEFATDIRKCRTHLESVLHDGEQIERGVKCPECSRKLTLVYGPRVVDDRWVCTKQDCEIQDYTRSQYRSWVEDDSRRNADRLTAADMAIRFTTPDLTLKASAVRVWGSRGVIRKRGVNGNGMTMYDVSDVRTRLEDAQESA